MFCDGKLDLPQTIDQLFDPVIVAPYHHIVPGHLIPSSPVIDCPAPSSPMIASSLVLGGLTPKSSVINFPLLRTPTPDPLFIDPPALETPTSCSALEKPTSCPTLLVDPPKDQQLAGERHYVRLQNLSAPPDISDKSLQWLFENTDVVAWLKRTKKVSVRSSYRFFNGDVAKPGVYFKEKYNQKGRKKEKPTLTDELKPTRNKKLKGALPASKGLGLRSGVGQVMEHITGSFVKGRTYSKNNMEIFILHPKVPRGE